MSRRLALLGAGLLALAAVVALATRARESGDGASRPVLDGGLLLEYAALVLLALVVLGLPVLAWALWTERSTSREWLPRRGNWIPGFVVTFLVGVLVIAPLLHTNLFGPHARSQPVSGGGAATAQRASEPSRPARLDWLPAAVVGGITLASVAASALLLVRRQRTGGRTRPDADAVAASLDDAIGDLRADPDARRAVIAAYARMERTLAGQGLARRPPEAPKEYLRRVLTTELGAGAAPVARLTTLFELAKFSPRRIDEAMKGQAIDALVAVRDALREQAPPRPRPVPA